MSDITTIAKDNALSDASDLASDLGRRFSDEDIVEYTRQGINLVAAAHRFVETYEGSNDFVRELRMKLGRYRKLTIPQSRAALNVLRDEQLGLKRGASTVATTSASTPTETRETRVYDCFKCKASIVGITALYEHKRECGRKPVEEEEEAPVIAVTTSTLNLDLSVLPNGRYAAPDLNNDRDNDFLFFSVTRTTKDKKRDRRYRYSKFRPGYERVPAGTIEVKEWSSDSKRLFGEQRPGVDADGNVHVYKGEFEEHLKLIMANPEAWARIFGQMIGRCFRCGKKLTDEESRDQGFGPECAKHINEYRRH